MSINHKVEEKSESHLDKCDAALSPKRSNPSPDYESLPQSIQPLVIASFNVHNFELPAEFADFRAFFRLDWLGLGSLAGGDAGGSRGAEAAVAAGDRGGGE